MLFVYVAFCLLWVAVFTGLCWMFRENKLAVLIVSLILVGIGIQFGLALGSVTVLFLAMATMVAVVFSIRQRPLKTLRFSLTLALIASFGFGLGVLLAGPDLQRIGALQKKLPRENLSDRLPLVSSYVMSSTPVFQFEKSVELNHDSRSTISNRRRRQLKYLHASQFEHFVDSPGFGLVRLSDRSTYLATDGAPHRAAVPVESSPGRFSIVRGITKDRLVEFHVAGVRDFVYPEGYGWVENRSDVVGFREHQFSQMPELKSAADSNKSTDSWNIIQLQLVSLLLHDRPVVYESANLPKMDDLKRVPIREHNEFELHALEALHSGKSEIILAERKEDELRMLGALRAQLDCLECHHVPEGALLGAFSYRLQELSPAKSSSSWELDSTSSLISRPVED